MRLPGVLGIFAAGFWDSPRGLGGEYAQRAKANEKGENRRTKKRRRAAEKSRKRNRR